ncbi:hypothetical protein F5B20DRAFT_589677 [Whalleya microplaca]|nr:hypothetical protein F5B20DRAFT_589677 [Whalleya microplaca]
MYLTACVSPDIIGGDVFKPRWKSSETLENFITRVYPRSQPAMQDTRSIRLTKLSAHYLTTYAKVDLKWTHRLSDHLVLLKGDTWKSLYVFQHPAFLKVSLETLAADDPDMHQSTAKALSLGCLPPRLLRETSMTLNILFPVAGVQASRDVLEKQVNKWGLDPGLLGPLSPPYGDHEHPQDAIDPSDVRGLYEKYQYWGERLYELWKEADDPTPTGRIEQWSESRRNPRFTYWCTIASLTIAIMFGMLATILGALQVWISYCSWINDPSASRCWQPNRNDARTHASQ